MCACLTFFLKDRPEEAFLINSGHKFVIPWKKLFSQQEHLAKAKDYAEAHKMKLKSDALEAWELEKWRNKRQVDLCQRESKFKHGKAQVCAVILSIPESYPIVDGFFGVCSVAKDKGAWAMAQPALVTSTSCCAAGLHTLRRRLGGAGNRAAHNSCTIASNDILFPYYHPLRNRGTGHNTLYWPVIMR